MANIDLKLTARVEEIREPYRPVSHPLHFDLAEIKKHFDEGLSGIEKQHQTASILYNNGQIEECQNIWRSEVVFLEGILDFFIHEISKYTLYEMFEGQRNKSDKYYTIKIPMSEVETAYSNMSSKEWFFSYLNQEMSREVYLSADSMKDQLNEIGITFNEVMQKAFPDNNVNASIRRGKEIVREMFDRRNRIVHQNDRDHASAVRTTITEEIVQTYKNNICKIVYTICDMVSET